MKISELINLLQNVKSEHGDIRVEIEADYFGGPYGGHNCTATANIEYSNITRAKDGFCLSLCGNKK